MSPKKKLRKKLQTSQMLRHSSFFYGLMAVLGLFGAHFSVWQFTSELCSCFSRVSAMADAIGKFSSRGRACHYQSTIWRAIS